MLAALIMTLPMEASVAHLHTYFLFPFAIDKDAVLQNHGDLWTDRRHWMHGLDRWIGAHAANGFAVPSKIGIWKRCAYTRFDLDSQAYADMVFFHPFVRRIFFDTVGMRQGDEEESLLRCYSLGGPGTPRLTLAAEEVLDGHPDGVEQQLGRR